MAVATLNETTYRKLIARALRRVVTSGKENERIITELEALDTRGYPLTPEEAESAKLLTALVQSPAFLHGVSRPSTADMIPVFGSSSVASDVFNGKRSISKAQARKLAEYFGVSVSLFI